MYAVTFIESFYEVYDFGFLGVFDEYWKVEKAIDKHKSTLTEAERNRTGYTIYVCDLDGDFEEQEYVRSDTNGR